MRSAISIPKVLLTHIDVMNTLGGGMSQPSWRVNKMEAGREVTVQVPGVDPINLKAEINNNRLTVFSITDIHSMDQEIPVPVIVYDKVIPYFIDIPKITSRQEGSSLVILMPVNNLANGYHRDLSEE